jgi:outer membrane receptor protein involved in Fe transport
MNRTRQMQFGFFRAALAVSMGMSLVIASSAFAQEAVRRPGGLAQGAVGSNPDAAATGGAEATAQRVIVTGSNIPTAEEVGPNPVLNINRDLINKSGERTLEQLLRNNPVANANGVPVSNNENGTNSAVGAATIALRGFDARATLILLDGRRVAPYPTGNNGVQVGIMFVDLNSIPQAAIQSIEILKDGASSTYGADAVAGVVNLKMRHEYRGAEVSLEYGNTLDKDSSQFAASLIFGVGDGTTNVSGVLNYYHRNSIFNHDRGFSAKPPFLSSNASPYNLQLTNAAVLAAGGTVVDTGTGNQFGRAPFFTNGLAPASAYVYTAGRSNVFNFNEFSSSFPESERWGGYVNFDHKICGEQLVFYGDMFYQNVKTHNELAAPATGSFQTRGQTTLAIPPSVPNPAGTTPFGGPTYAETGVTPGAFNPFNPFNQIISGGTRARLAEFGNRLFDNETDAYLTTVGVKGDKLFDGTWGYDAGFRFSQVKNVQTGTQVSASRFNRVLNQADPIFDPTSSQFIGTTIAFNPFGDFRVPIASNAGSLAFATVHPKDIDVSKLATVDATMYTTSLFNLPAGGIGFAFGGQFRRESLVEAPDGLNEAGDVVGNSPVPTALGGRKSYAFYGETSIPIFSPNNAIPGFYALELTAAGRFEEFRNNDTNVMVPKFGARWQPLDESLTLRATWGKGFRQPSLEELFAAPISTLQVSNDPQNIDPVTGLPLFESETNTLVGSNPNLQPEDSETISVGAVYTPKYVPGLTLSTDFWEIERTGVVNAPTANQVLAREAAGALLPGEVVERDAANLITRIIISNQNAGGEKARGIDFGIQYQLPTPWGTFTSLTQATYLDAFLFQQVEGGPTDNLRGRTTNEGASNEGYYKWKGDSRLDWTWNQFNIITTVRYTDGFHEQRPSGAPHYVKQTFIFDVQGSYDFSFVAPVESQPVAGYSKDPKDVTRGKDGKAVETDQTADYSMPCWKNLLNNATITVGCNNVFGQDPPKAFGQGGNAVGYPGFTYDATGRFVYARLTKRF